MYDKDMQKFFVYARFLSKCLPKGENEKVDLSDKLILEYYKLDKTFSGDIALEKSEGYVANIKGGIGGKEKKEDPLSVIIDKMNERFGTNFSEQDRVLQQVSDVIKRDQKIVNAVADTDKALYKYLFKARVKDIMVQLYEQNDKFFMELFTDEEKLEFTMNMLSEAVYKDIRKNILTEKRI